jgi:hypothetical protein
VLVYHNTKLAIIEAKAWDEALTEGVAQAKNYAGKQALSGKPAAAPHVALAHSSS